MADTNGSEAVDDIYGYDGHGDAARLGLRERHKRDKVHRISQAARVLFSERGYEGTTLRDIANHAEVALGTLSLYAEDKRDLIVMLFNQLIPPLMDEAARSLRPDAGLLDNMVSYFTPFYEAYAKETTLYRIVLGQIFNRLTSAHAQQHARIRTRIIGTLESIIDQAIKNGEIAGSGDRSGQAHSFFYIYFASVRMWLTHDVVLPEAGIADLRAMFSLHIDGMGLLASARPKGRSKRSLS